MLSKPGFQMDDFSEVASYPSLILTVLGVNVDSHILSLKPVVKGFQHPPFPGHTSFQVSIECFLCCTKSKDSLGSIKE
jgi:hypothetical protein